MAIHACHSIDFYPGIQLICGGGGGGAIQLCTTEH